MRLVDCFCELFAYVLHLLDDPAQQYAEASQVHERCLGLVEAARQSGKENGYERHRFEEALFAVVVWIDEAILCSSLPIRREWPNYLLQLHFFNTNNGGDEFYDCLEAVNPEDEQLTEVFTYCFALGFHGQLYADSEILAEKRAELYLSLRGDEEAASSDRLFPAGYRSSKAGQGYKPPQRQSMRTAVLFLLPLFVLACGYIICSYRLGVQMRAVLGM